MNDKLKATLVQAKTDKGTTQRAVAKACAVSESRLSNWIAGRRCPTPDQLRRLCRFFGVLAAELGFQTVYTETVRQLPERV